MPSFNEYMGLMHGPKAGPDLNANLPYYLLAKIRVLISLCFEAVSIFGSL